MRAEAVARLYAYTSIHSLYICVSTIFKKNFKKKAHLDILESLLRGVWSLRLLLWGMG